MTAHEFLLTLGTWNGQGTISFSISPETLNFFTQWEVQPKEGNSIQASQTVQMQGTQEILRNHFVFSNLTADSFSVTLSNELLGTVHGTGIIDNKQIAWEFRGHPNVEGLEVYRLNKDTGEYLVHAEYTSSDQYRTIIEARIWKKFSSDV